MAAAVQAIDAKEYARAIPMLEEVVTRLPDNADAYNWLAYATRKNGDPAASIPLYQKALAIDPKHRGAHEYIGEAYLMLNDLPKTTKSAARRRARARNRRHRHAPRRPRGIALRRAPASHRLPARLRRRRAAGRRHLADPREA
jgi:tetratricopeptide (TPR) repeat protein